MPKKDRSWFDELNIGPATRKRLEEAGVLSPEHLLEFTVDELVELGVELQTAERILLRARQMLGREPRSLRASELLKLQFPVVKTGVGEFDGKTPWGGLRMGYIYEFAGEFGVGKSLMAHQTAAATVTQGHGRVAYVDNEGTFSPSVLVRMVKRFGGDEAKLDDVFVYVPENITSLELYVKFELPKLIVQEGVRTIIIDTITALYRAEFRGREFLAERQQRLHYLLDWLRRHTRVFGVLVVLTNQVIDIPSGYFDLKKPAGGNVLAHTVNARFMMFRPSKSKPEGHMTPFDVPGMGPDIRMEYSIDDDGLH